MIWEKHTTISFWRKKIIRNIPITIQTLNIILGTSTSSLRRQSSIYNLINLVFIIYLIPQEISNSQSIVWFYTSLTEILLHKSTLFDHPKYISTIFGDSDASLPNCRNIYWEIPLLNPSEYPCLLSRISLGIWYLRRLSVDRCLQIYGLTASHLSSAMYTSRTMLLIWIVQSSTIFAIYQYI